MQKYKEQFSKYTFYSIINNIKDTSKKQKHYYIIVALFQYFLNLLLD